MYLVFYNCGDYKVFEDRNKALDFCKTVGVTWIEE